MKAITPYSTCLSETRWIINSASSQIHYVQNASHWQLRCTLKMTGGWQWLTDWIGRNWKDSGWGDKGTSTMYLHFCTALYRVILDPAWSTFGLARAGHRCRNIPANQNEAISEGIAFETQKVVRGIRLPRRFRVPTPGGRGKAATVHTSFYLKRWYPSLCM